MTQLDFIPRTQKECALVGSIIRNELGWTLDCQRRLEGIARLRAWLGRGR